MLQSAKLNALFSVLLTLIVIIFVTAAQAATPKTALNLGRLTAKELFEGKDLVTSYSQPGVKVVRVKLDKQGNVIFACKKALVKDSYLCTDDPAQILALSKPELL